MLKKVAIGATALTLLASVVVYAQQPPAGTEFGRRAQMRSEDRAAFLDARVAALHAGLRLTADQEKSWPAFEQAYRDVAKLRMQRRSRERAEQQMVDPIQRAQRGADALAARSAALKKYADAASPLYQSLDNNQKRRFAVLSRFHRRHDRQFASMRDVRQGGGNFSVLR
jgi:zinc resistance-associated protein